MIHNNTHCEIICNLFPFMFINKQECSYTNKIHYKNKQSSDNYFYNKNADFFIHCILLCINNYVIDNMNIMNYQYHKLHCQYDFIKNDTLHIARHDTNAIFKKYKICTFKHFSNSIFSCKFINPELFFFINIFNNITIIIIQNNKAYFFGDNNNNISGYIISDDYKYFTKTYNFNPDLYYHIYNPFKPINSISSYKISDLYVIANKLNIPIKFDNKNRLKKDIYDDIKSNLIFNW